MQRIAVAPEVSTGPCGYSTSNAQSPGHCLPPLEPAALLLVPMDDLDTRVVFINAAIAQIDNDLLRRFARVPSRIVVCSSCRARMCPSYGFPGKVRAPMTSPLLWVTVMLALTPNS